MMSNDDNQPLLGEERLAEPYKTKGRMFNDVLWLSAPGRSISHASSRARVQQFLTSKLGHYAVLLLVCLDVCCIFADFLISLFLCEQKCGKDQRGSNSLIMAQELLGVVSLVFSCLFMAELVASVWAFGFRLDHRVSSHNDINP